MGVPKFFRWLSERYPLTVQRYGSPVSKSTYQEHYGDDKEGPDYQSIPDPLSTIGLPPRIDRLYIDMNGIIHGCSHNNMEEDVNEDKTIVDDSDKSSVSLPQSWTEDDIFASVCYYLDRVVRDIAQPQELLYLAIDGVAPRAKLNQQRARRYRSAKEGEIEKTVYDAHLEQEFELRKEKVKELSYLGQDEEWSGSFEKFSDSQKRRTDSDSKNPLKEVEPGRFTGKFEMREDSETSKSESYSGGNNDFGIASLHDADGDDDGEPVDFHSNLITPGTAFFQRCTEHLEHFIQYKISTDPAWQKLTVIFSGSNTPGEGEHKIMQFIREQQSLEDYQPNLRHCIMGQDGDLIMLGLACHEPNLFLLRERIIFCSKRRQALDSQASKYGLGVYLHNSHFDILHMSVLRDYLAMEFQTSNILPKSKFDLESTIDDFIFLTFLVGNDFLSSLPALDIADDAFDLLFYTYRDQRKHWIKDYERGSIHLPYLTHAGKIVSGKRLEQFLQQVGSYESRYYDYKDSTKDLDDVRRVEAKFGNQMTPDDEILESKEAADRSRYRELVAAAASQKAADDDFVPAMNSSVTLTFPGIQNTVDEKEEQQGLLNRFGNILHFSVQDDVKTNQSFSIPNVAQINDKDFKGRYYADKFGFSPYDKEKHLALRKAYLEGLVWTLQYYYHKTVSWEWFYPFHYGPMISDLTGLDKMLKEVAFIQPGSPLLPFQQLLACMPASHAHILPKPYRTLMTDKASPLSEFYPESFTVDMNGKRWPWEAVVLLPFIDSKKLVDATSKISPEFLSEEEQARNVIKDAVVYWHDIAAPPRSLPALNAENSGTTSKKMFGELPECNTAKQTISESIWCYGAKPAKKAPLFQPILQPGVELPLDGLPTLRDGSVSSMQRTPVRINVHGTPSRYHTALLDLRNNLPEIIPTEVLAQHLIGTTVYMNYPFMVEAFVTAVSDSQLEIRGKEQLTRHWTPNEATDRKVDVKRIFFSHLRGAKLTGTGGMRVPGIGEDINAEVLLSVRPLKGIRTLEDGTLGKTFCKFETQVPLFVTSWRPVNEDLRLRDLPLLVEKDPFSAAMGRYVSLRTGSLHLNMQDSMVSGDAPSDAFLLRGRQDRRKSSFRGFATWARPINQTPDGADPSKVSKIPLSEKFLCGGQDKQKSSFRGFVTCARELAFNKTTVSAGPEVVLTGSDQLTPLCRKTIGAVQRIRAPTPRGGKVLAAGVFAAAWLLSGATAASVGPFDSCFGEGHVRTGDLLGSCLFGSLDPSTLGKNDPNYRKSGSVSPLHEDMGMSLGEESGPIQARTAPPLQFANGTTTLAFIFQGGIVVAVDSRASLGNFIGSKTVQKVLPIHPKLLGTMAGGAADCSFWIRKLAARAALYEALHDGQTMSVARASRFLSNVLYSNRGRGLSMGTMIMGYDNDDQSSSVLEPRLFYVDDRGTRIEGDMFAVGSGSTYALSVLDGHDLYTLSTEEAILLAVQAIRYATLRDGSSGGFINVYHIGPNDKEWRRVFRQDVAGILAENCSYDQAKN